MAYTVGDLDSEIAAKVEWLQEHNGRVIHKAWLMRAVLADHPAIEGEDAEFHLCCAQETIRERVRRFFGIEKNRQEEESSSKQLVMEGFERLQKRYITTRDGEQVIVLAEEMKREELLAKAQELRSMGRGLFAHADEIDRFIEMRFGTQAA